MRRVFVALGLVIASGGLAAFGVAGDAGEQAGVVYTASNGAASNEVLVFDRNERGELSFARAVPTGGAGTGGGLGSQGAIALSADGRWLIVVNAGSNDISVFRANGGELQLASRTPSGGQRPVSVAIDADLVYVLNAGGAVGGADNIAGFHLARTGGLAAIPGAVRPLSAPATTPSEVAFTPDGRSLVVTEQATNMIDLFPIADAPDGGDGAAGPGEFFPSAGVTPFGFAFDKRGHLLVAEAAGGVADASSASSYIVTEAGGVQAISPAVPTTETSACWLVVTQDGRTAYTTNTGSGTVSAFAIDNNGRLALLDADGVAGNTGAGSATADAALSAGSRFLYTRNGGNRTISAFRVGPGGGLAAVSAIGGLPAGSVGLAAR